VCRDSFYSNRLQGLVKGQECGFIDIGKNGSFNPAEYEYYDHPAHGDMHVIIPGKVRPKDLKDTRSSLAEV
jgi:hypothetical protein